MIIANFTVLAPFSFAFCVWLDPRRGVDGRSFDVLCNRSNLNVSRGRFSLTPRPPIVRLSLGTAW